MVFDFLYLHEIQIILDNTIDKDVAGGVMPNLVYVSREKSNNKPHNFKAGALNVLVISQLSVFGLVFLMGRVEKAS